jgi:hypothetical protein
LCILSIISIQVTPEGIQKLFTNLRAAANRDKKDLCLTLTVINKNVEDWYNEVNKLIARKDSYSTSQIKEALGERRRIPATDRAIMYMDYIEERYNRNELKKNIREKLYPDKIRVIKDNLSAFMSTIKYAKDMERSRLILDAPDESDVKLDDNLISWIEPLRDRINQLTTKLVFDLECAGMDITESYKEYTK